MSVARSFLASGAKATLSTLWPVPDRANAEFMKEFYFALTQRASDAVVALVEAQRKMKLNPKFNNPYYWGGFVLHVVDGRYRPVDPGRVAHAR
jgi:CHAT domain-containing protein